MSTSLYWTPPPVEQEEHCLNLKHEIARFYNPEWNGNSVPEWNAGKELIPFLKGAKAVTSDDYIKDECDQVIAAIQKYGQIVMHIR